MSTDRTLDRVRAANPAPAVAIDNHELFARIVASPGDPRLREARLKRRRFALRRHPVALFGACLALVTCGTAGAAKLGLIPDFGVFARDTPAQLFKANPSGLGGLGSHHQVVNLRTVHRVASATVPGLGTYKYWIALSKKGWLCSAIRLPDDTWADTSMTPSKFQISGPVPGCGWSWPYHGYAYYPSSVRSPDGRGWRLIWGYGPSVGHPVAVRDKFSGVTAPIGDGRYFMIVLPLCGERGVQRCSDYNLNPPTFQLQTLDASGRVLSDGARDRGE
jgi:hypothetical protein